MGMREPLEKWFYAKGIRPRIVAEFEDAGLMKVAASRPGSVLPWCTPWLRQEVAWSIGP